MFCSICEKSRTVLGIPRTATVEEMKASYRELMMVWDPDRFGNDEKLRRKAEAQTKEIKLAHDHLTSHMSSESAPDPQGKPETRTYKGDTYEKGADGDWHRRRNK